MSIAQDECPRKGIKQGSVEHLPLDGFWYSARGIGLVAYLLVRHDDCDAIEQYPLSMPTSAIVAAYRAAHPPAGDRS